MLTIKFRVKKNFIEKFYHMQLSTLRIKARAENGHHYSHQLIIIDITDVNMSNELIIGRVAASIGDLILGHASISYDKDFEQECEILEIISHPLSN